jgi:hypothetical protein
LKNVFLHEPGHILGLRHEFALAQEGIATIQFGQINQVSVMSYAEPPPGIQQSNETAIKAFYQLVAGDKLEGCPVTDFIP